VRPVARWRVPAAGEHGGDGEAVAAALGLDPSAVLDLSLSLNPVAPDFTSLLGGHVGRLRRYPDPSRATAALAERIGVDRDRVLLTNGGAEAIALVAQDLGRGWVEAPDFGLYGRHLERLEPGAPLWRSNPRNPTGELAAAWESAAVWDEAFYPLAAARWTRGDADTGSVVVGSLTKLLACPGLRAGYVVAQPETIARLAARQPRWSVNGLACSALPEMLEKVDLVGWALAVADLRGQLVEVLGRHGLRARRSDACYVLLDGAAALRERLAPEGVVVRDCTSFGLPGCARVAVPAGEGLARLDAALERTSP
jgi:histidinol-phosphate/aromatic aminotransferase/cobyric acid decarboxylase-like protein